MRNSSLSEWPFWVVCRSSVIHGVFVAGCGIPAGWRGAGGGGFRGFFADISNGFGHFPDIS